MYCVNICKHIESTAETVPMDLRLDNTNLCQVHGGPILGKCKNQGTPWHATVTSVFSAPF